MADEVFTCSICKSFSGKTFPSVLRHIGKFSLTITCDGTSAQ